MFLSLLAWGLLLWLGVQNPIRGVPKSLCGGCFGDNEEKSTTDQSQTSVINYTPEAQAAQKTWWQTLQDWQTSGDWGATDMNWDDILKSAERKVNQYYWGGVGTTGLAGKVKASAARRNVSQSPAVENQLALLGMQESQDIQDLITNLTAQKATYTESARKNWLSSLMGLSGFKSGETTTGTSTTTKTSEEDSILSKLLSAGTSGILTGLSSDWLKNLMGGQTATAQSSITPESLGWY